MLMTLRTLTLLLVVSATPALAQIPDALLDNFRPREVGPAFMGGRTVDLAVYEEDPAIFYAATASGGLLKTVNGGNSWVNVFDRQSTVSIGDVAINPTDHNVIWVGTGEANNRQSSSWGDGIYKSTDGGRTWQHMGLRESHHIGPHRRQPAGYRYRLRSRARTPVGCKPGAWSVHDDRRRTELATRAQLE